MDGRHILPMITERTGYGEHSTDPYSKLLSERIIFLGTQVDDASANDVMAQLLYLDHESPDRDISLYLNSPGGSVTAMTAIYDTIRLVNADVRTVCLGQAASAAAILLAAGTPGKRLILPNARVVLHQPALASAHGQTSDLEIQAREILRIRALMVDLLVTHSGQTPDRIRADIDRDTVFTAHDALAYGLVDEIAQPRRHQSLSRAA